ncbi:MAG: helix-hairpin-helix domain-containing protein [Thermoguttaceae bacterium]|nr:helix-hairpin-helix domain-containing protein [Thermoguttaceae bacterium]MBQ7112601.1 helix-hairpin-helix domain-containing protein [Thermoguttaceae bacterium]
MSAKRRPKKRKAAPPPAAKKPTKPEKSENKGGSTAFQAEKSESQGGSTAFQTEKTESQGGSTAFQAENVGGSAPSPSTRPPQPAKSTSSVAFRFFDAVVAGGFRLKTSKSVSKFFNGFSRTSARLFDGSARPKTPRQEADDRQARFVAGVAALAFAVGVVFFFAGKTSRRLAPPSKPGVATISTPQKLADAVAAEVVKERSNAIRRRAILETSVKTAANAAAPDDVNNKADFKAARVAELDANPDAVAVVATVPPVETLSFIVELNTASKAELTNLPRVGEKLAERIIERREELGGFRSVDDLLGVKGIGEKTLDKMRPHCVVAPLDEAE